MQNQGIAPRAISLRQFQVNILYLIVGCLALQNLTLHERKDDKRFKTV